MTVEPEFSHPVDVTTLPQSGRTYTVQASDDARARVAERLGLQSVGALAAVFEIAPGSKGTVKVTGQLTADVVQTCVVSLAPVPAHVTDAKVSVSFITEEKVAADKLKTERAKAKRPSKKDDEEADEEVLAPEGDDPPEVALGGRIDLGEVTVVHLALALDPYPRAPGAAFDAKAWGVEPEKDEKSANVSPFAALAKLKKPGA